MRGRARWLAGQPMIHLDRVKMGVVMSGITLMRCLRAALQAVLLMFLFATLQIVPATAGSKLHCPPGLAKKGSCIPPGQRKHWVVGDYIPPDVVYRRVIWQDLGLPRPKPGYIYAEIAGDIYLLAEATQRVIEAIALVDAATR